MPDMSALNFKETSTFNINLDLDDSSHFNLDDLLISKRGEKSDKDRKTVEKDFVTSGSKSEKASISDKFFEVNCLMDYIKTPDELNVAQVLDNLNQIITKVYKLKDKKSLNNRMSPRKKRFGGFKDKLNELGWLISC